MRKMIFGAIATTLFITAPLFAQSTVQILGTNGTTARNAAKVNSSGELIVSCATGCSGGGGGGGDASAANQTTQITAVNLTNTRLGDVTSPATGSVNYRLNQIFTNIGSPFQAGASIANTVFGATQSGTWNVTNISGTINLPTGAATAAKQDTLLTALGTPLQAGGTVTALSGGNSFCHISTATTTTCKSGAGVLHTLSVNNLGTVASATTVYDNTAGSGTVIAVINTLAGQTSYIYDVTFATGLTIVTTGTVAPDITASYR